MGSEMCIRDRFIPEGLQRDFESALHRFQFFLAVLVGTQARRAGEGDAKQEVLARLSDAAEAAAKVFRIVIDGDKLIAR